jgi:cation:H+ antiporter
MVFVLIAGFVTSLLISVGAAASFTRRLEIISDHLHFSPGLLSLLGALGANIPNYVASLAAAISGQVGVGIGIIVGSNIYNIAVILGISAFASPARQGMTLSHQEAQDARVVGGITLALIVMAGLATGVFSWRVSPSLSLQAMLEARIALLVLNLLTLGLFGALAAHALRRHGPEELFPTQSVARDTDPVRSASPLRSWETRRVLGEMIVALCIALLGVIVMVQAGEAAALDLHLPSAILSLIILAVATSLPNTVVAFTLARTGRASASIEEVFSSNGVNAALGIALPLLFWSSIQGDRFLVTLDGPLMVALTGVVLLLMLKRRVSRAVGLLLVLVYVAWILIHVLL